MTDGGLVLLPPPQLQPANQAALTLVQTFDALLQQLETFLQKIYSYIYACEYACIYTVYTYMDY